MQGIPFVCCYLDDLLITGPTEKDHLKSLEEVLRRLSKSGLRLKKDKCTFNSKSVIYLGYKIDEHGLHPTDEKVCAIKSAPAPRNVTELRSYLGILNYYGRFLPDLSSRLAPLHLLLHKGVSWRWGNSQRHAFESTRNMLHSSIVLVHYDPNRELVLSTDASPYGVGSVLSHRCPDGSDQPIAYASRSLTVAEKNYSQLDKEALAIIFGIKKFHQYIYGRHVTICSDHKPLYSLFNERKAIPPMASPRVQRWALTLSAYDYTMTFREGKANANADALSRLPLPNHITVTPAPADVIHLLDLLSKTPVNAENIRNWTRVDPRLSKVYHYVMTGWPRSIPENDLELKPYFDRRTELSVHNGVLLWGSRVVVPPQGRISILHELHSAHPGIVRMKALARSYVWWPKLDVDIDHKIRACRDCQIQRDRPAKAPLHPWNWPDKPWTRLHLDYAGPFLGQMYLIIIDAYSKWLEVIPTSTSTAQVTAKLCRRVFATHGLPCSIVTDNGTSFTGREFQEFTRRNGITLC